MTAILIACGVVGVVFVASLVDLAIQTGRRPR